MEVAWIPSSFVSHELEMTTEELLTPWSLSEHPISKAVFPHAISTTSLLEQETTFL